MVRDSGLMGDLGPHPSRQIIGAQRPRAPVLAKLGLLGNVPACTYFTTKPWVEEAGVRVLDQPFVAHGNVATAGGCLASHYLAAWVIARLAGWDAAESIVDYVAPVGLKREYVERAPRGGPAVSTGARTRGGLTPAGGTGGSPIPSIGKREAHA